MFKQFKGRDKDFWEGVDIAKKVYLKLIFNKFDEYACIHCCLQQSIKDDKWYLDYKKQILNNNN